MIESSPTSQVGVDHGPFAGFVLRRVLRALVAATLVVLLTGVVVAVTDDWADEPLRAARLEACIRAAELRFEDIYVLRGSGSC